MKKLNSFHLKMITHYLVSIIEKRRSTFLGNVGQKRWRDFVKDKTDSNFPDVHMKPPIHIVTTLTAELAFLRSICSSLPWYSPTNQMRDAILLLSRVGLTKYEDMYL